MKHIVEQNWTTGSNIKIDFYKILKIIKQHTVKGSKIFIGSDSFVSNKKICFASAICLYGGSMPSRYFYLHTLLYSLLRLCDLMGILVCLY